VESGHVIPKRDIASCQGSSVRFTDGTSADVDAIVTCSGYRAAFPFLDESVKAGTDPRNWFKYIFYNQDPSLAFVGFARPIFGSIPGLAEMQSRCVAKVFSERVGSRGRPRDARPPDGTPGSGTATFATRPSGSRAWWIISSIPINSRS